MNPHPLWIHGGRISMGFFNFSPLARRVQEGILSFVNHRGTVIASAWSVSVDDEPENIMNYICLGYLNEKKWESVTESQQHELLDECFAHDDVLRKNGHFAGGAALQSVRNATTLRRKSGKVALTDGPYAETKEQLGGIMVLEATAFNQAVQLRSKHRV